VTNDLATLAGCTFERAWEATYRLTRMLMGTPVNAIQVAVITIPRIVLPSQLSVTLGHRDVAICGDHLLNARSRRWYVGELGEGRPCYLYCDNGDSNSDSRI
jgi:hypothetical protein